MDSDDESYARLWQLLWSCCDAPQPIVVWSELEPDRVLLVLCANCETGH